MTTEPPALKLARGPRPPALTPRPPEVLTGAERTLRAYVPIFLGWFGMVAGMSPLSVKSYEDGLKSFLAFCDLYGVLLPQQVTPDAVEAFMGTLRQQGRSANTANHRRAVLISFFKFLQRKQVVETNPAKLAVGMKGPRNLPGYIPSGGQRPILEHLMRDRSTLGLRNLAVIGTFLLCGLRAAELAELRLSHLDPGSKMLKVVQGKGRRDRFVVVIAWLREVLTQYVELARPELLKGREEAHVFLSRTGRPMCTRVLWSLVSRVLSPLAEKHVHPHMLRHSFASRVLAGGGNLVALQKAMGHSNLDTTSIYTHLPDDLYVRQFTSWLSGESPAPEPPATLPPLEAMAQSLEPDLPPPPDPPEPHLELPPPPARLSHPFADPKRRAELRAKRHTWKKERS